MLEPDSDQHRKDLADTLRQLRRAAGLSGERLAARAAMSQPKISRIESGKALPSVSDVERIMQALDVPAEIRAELLALTRSANVEYTSLRSSARMGIWRSQAEIKALVETSSVVRQFLPAIPSELIQTPDYARAVLTPGVEGRPARDIERAVQARLESQEALNDESRTYHFLLTEQAVRLKRAGNEVMADQLRHMTAMMDRSNVDLSVLPSSALVNASQLNVFVVYDDRIVLTEVFAGEVALRDYRDVSYHLSIFDHFRDRAFSGSSARRILNSVADEFMRGPD
ncbi:helix-turn-helix domain-containing protein [Saccharopolyspora tripterygii]